MSKNKITNIRELQERLIAAFEQLEADPRRLAQASELSNTAGKILDCAKLEVAYRHLRGEKPEVPFIAEAADQKLLESPKP